MTKSEVVLKDESNEIETKCQRIWEREGNGNREDIIERERKRKKIELIYRKERNGETE